MSIAKRIGLVLVAALVGWCVGWAIDVRARFFPRMKDYLFLAEPVPLPHHVPKYADGVSFRFAMAQDVIHERFPRHGPDYYRERDRLTREKIAKLKPDDPAGFPLADDLGVGLDRLGKSDEAAEVLRAKLAKQTAQAVKGRDLYTSYADLGTFLIHGNFKNAMAGDPAARERLAEGIGFIRKSVEVNPEAHFGREQWQAAIAEFLYAASADAALLKTYDCIGNRLDLEVKPILDSEGNRYNFGLGRATDRDFNPGELESAFPAFFHPDFSLDDPANWRKVSPIRRYVTKVGAETGWEKVAVPSHREPVPFDEPVLGIIGMWRQGGGANPHFALALGETMLRVGQRFIAWSAFERASRLAEKFSPDPKLQQFLRDHCRDRQAEIEKTLAHQYPAKQLRPEFEAELAYGEGFQKAYQEFESKKIAAGAPINDEHFFDAFYEGRDPIATRPGPEEWYVRVPRRKMYAYVAERQTSLGLLGAGLAAMATALATSRFRVKSRSTNARDDDHERGS